MRNSYQSDKITLLNMYLRSTSFIIVMFFPFVAFPQSDAEREGAIEEITVTAQRRAENLQTVPLAITAFSEKELKEQRIQSLKDLSERTPSVFIGEFKPGQSQVYIRGIGSTEDGAAADQSVILFIDEVYVGRTGGQAVDLFDLERVEVLRGPQGTLFGKNVVGGAVNFVTKKPTEVPEASLQATFGSLNEVTLRGYASGPLAENVFGKIAFSRRKRDGYHESVIDEFPEFFPEIQRDFIDDLTQLDVNTDNVRGALRWLPSDKIEVNISAGYTTRDEKGTPRYYLPGPGDGGDFNRTDDAAIDNYEGRIRVGLFDDPGVYKMDSWSTTARVDYDVTPNLMFTSLSSFRKVEWRASDILGTRDVARIRLSTGAAPFTFVGDNPAAEASKTYTQEFRLTSQGDSRLEWVAGLYYLYDDIERHETSNLGIVLPDGSGGLIDLLPQILGGDEQFNTTNSYAVFGQATYNVTDRTRLTIGARYTDETKDVFKIGTAGGLVVNENYLVDSSESWSEFTPKISLDYQATDDMFLYLTASKGFKSGGFQGLSPTEFAAETPFDPETAWLYEFGFKTEWLDNRLRLNGAIYYMDYTDLQVVQGLIPEDSETDTPVLVTSNAADAEIEGIELEFTLLPVADLRISGFYSYLDATFVDFFVPAGFRIQGTGGPSDRAGNKLRKAPENSYSVRASYDIGMENGGSVRLLGSWRHIGKAYGEADNLEYGANPAYSVATARVTYEFPEGDWAVSIWSDNLFDEDYFVNNFPNVGSGWAVPGPPRTYGITVNWFMR